MRQTASKLILAAATLAPLAGLLGCAGFNVKESLPWQEKKEEPLEEPRSVVAVWNENVLHHNDGRPATRGFGGRLLFYGQNPDVPIKTEGKLVVYAYDETQASLRGEAVSATGKPTRKYEFAADKFAHHYGESTVGHSYNFWIPWDNAGGERCIITLAPMLVLPNGKTIPGEPQKCMLEGRTPQVKTIDVDRYEYTPGVDDGTVQPVSYEEPAKPKASPPRRTMEATTINIPPSLARRATGMAPPSAQSIANPSIPAERSTPVPNGQPVTAPAGNGAMYPNADQPQDASPALNSSASYSTARPTAYQPPPRGRFGLGQPPAPARPTAPPTTSQPSWPQYRSAQPPHPRVELGLRPPLNVPGTSIAGPSTQR